MRTRDLTEILRHHPFISDLSDHYLQTLLSCVTNVRFKEGNYLFREGEEAGSFYLIRTGRVALEIHAGERGTIRVQTISPGEVLGWSWLISPYLWQFDACAVGDVRAFAFDGKCLRTKCETDHDFGYEMLRRFSHILEQHLKATRLQLLDVYKRQ
jgi:CRP-like cAMP-binding protein